MNQNRPRKIIAAWVRALEEHSGHRGFRAEGWAYSREVGFSCGCAECGDQEWRLNLAHWREVDPRVREYFSRLYRQVDLAGSKKKRRDLRRADIKAKAILHSQLTREQRWELRATKAFTITARNGKQYRITEGSASNVQLLEGGLPVQSLCVVAQGVQLPVYDLMLAQKLLLEASPEHFLQLAVVRDIPQPELADPSEPGFQQVAHFAATG
jgi:hypothetical protein